MYTVHAYYLSVVCQTLSCCWMYPVLMSLGSFYCFGFEFHEGGDLMRYMGALILQSLAGAFFGLSTGTYTDKE